MITDKVQTSITNTANKIVSGWVPVSESLPTKSRTVDIVIKNEYGRYRVPNAEYSLKDFWNKTDSFKIYQQTDDGMGWTDVTSQVLYWMIPPALPCR